MGTCLSKKKTKPTSSSSSAVNNGGSVAASPAPQAVSAVVPLTSAASKPKSDGEEAPTQAKKEVFLIKHRRSHENSRPSPVTTEEDESEAAVTVPEKIAAVRTSSCTKEEVDAILIQCGRLSRSSSGKGASSSASIERGSGGGRRYSGSKRSYDFDQCGSEGGEDSAKNEIVCEEASEKRVGRHRRSSPSPQGRRRTPSRERDQNQRSSSRERRVSRSPGRRGSSSAETGEPATVTNRPGKLVSVPATVSSLVMDRSNNGEPVSGNVIKRISVKRNVGDGARTAASPRSQSPARANGKSSNETQQQVTGSLSRNGSRKAEHSPYRRNPLSEIDPNSLAYPNQSSNRSQSRGKREAEGDEIIVKDAANLPTQIQRNQGHKTSTRLSTDNKSTTVNLIAAAPPQSTVETTVVISDTKPAGLTRSRSGRRSRDFDFTPEALLSNANATPSYTRLLLADIHNFHQKNSGAATTNNTVVTLPPCVSKACSILEAVADLNNNGTVSSAAGSSNIVATEVGGADDLNEPSFHKYVTVRRGAVGYAGGEASDDQESSGSNSVAGSIGQANHWGGLSSSSWEPNSADSTDRWSSGSKAGGSGGGGRSGGIGRGRLGSAKGLQAAPAIAST